VNHIDAKKLLAADDKIAEGARQMVETPMWFIEKILIKHETAVLEVMKELHDRIHVLEAALQPFATEFEIADAAGELQHWPENEAKHCKAAWMALQP
jgi:hypothetical protein